MKTIIQNLLGAALLVAASLQIHAQGTLVYDQQSTNSPSPLGDYLDIQPQPLTQSFIPALSAIGFVQLEFWDIPNNGVGGATVYVKLWAGSPNPSSSLAILLASTMPVYMPNGFGAGFAGVTNFFFSTPTSLVPGQTYYLQPVVLSGDNPWDVWAPGDSYSNGQLFEGNYGFNTDLWFREGIVPVPEPTAFALAGLSSFLFISFKRRSKLFVLLFAGILVTVLILPVHAAADSVVQATADEAGLAPATTLPRAGTFWVITTTPNGQLINLPYPSLPDNLSTLPIFSAADNIFIVDNTGGHISSASIQQMSRVQTAAIAQAQSEDVLKLIAQIQFPTNTYGTNEYYQPYDYPSLIFTNGLWLEVLNTNRVATNLLLRLHGTVSGDYYQMLSISDLTYANWDLGEIVNAYDTNADFSPISGTNAMKFYRAHHANPIMEIWNIQNTTEPNPTNSDPGRIGNVYIWNEGSATNDVTVYYRVGGTAQGGIDYSNLAGSVVVSNNQGYVEVDIDPIADGLKPDQTVILTLTQNTNYLIDPANYSATNILFANPEVYPKVRGDREQLCPNLASPIYPDASDPRGLPLVYIVLVNPAYGTLSTNETSSYFSYTPTNCFEGIDSFTFVASDGQYTSAVATVTLIVADSVYANAVSAQTCRNISVGFTLNGGDSCSESLSYAVLSHPLSGALSGTPPNLIYKPNSASFTGTDSFSYAVFGECGNAATNLVTITVGDQNISGVSQTTVTGTNQPISLVLTAVSNGYCDADTNDYLYSIVNPPTSGTLSGTPPNLIYTPTNGFEGQDSFPFTAGDGVWTSSPATVTIDVVAGPILFRDCNPFGTGVALDWVLDTTVSAMQLNIQDFIIYRSINGGTNFTAIATNYNSASWMSYLDTNIVVGQTNYYVVTFEAYDSAGILHDSPFSNEIEASAQNPGLLITATNFWNVVTNLNAPASVTNWQTPFSSYGTNQYPGLLPLPNTYWPVGTTWSNYVTMVIPTNSVPLSQVTYSIAIDNDYQLYLNESNAPIETFNHQDFATWSPFKSFESVAPGLLHYGTNSLRIVIVDEGGVTYFSMMVSTNACHGQ